MISFDFDKNCSGCGVCMNKCPVNAIQMVSNEEGFLMPLVDEKNCVNCHKCEEVCPHINGGKHILDDKAAKAYLYASKDNEVKKSSSSGAAFYEISKAFLANVGVICGCSYDQSLKTEHIMVERLEDLYKLQGSKYVQSNTKIIYRQIKEKLEEGTKVLFSGTPCQCTAAKLYVSSLPKDYKGMFYTVAIICHGVPSPLAWETYKEWMNQKYKDELVGINFRDKMKEGYRKQFCKHTFKSGKVVYTPSYLPTSKFMESSIVYNLTIRNSCSACDCKGINDCCDIILGDWYQDFTGEGELGTSCMTICTEAGLELSSYLTGLREIEYEKIKEANKPIAYSTFHNAKRSEFLRSIKDYRNWNRCEKYYPKKYKLKKLLLKLGLYNLLYHK